MSMTLADPAFLSVRLPAPSRDRLKAAAAARGETVHVDFRPPGWDAELATWTFAVVGGAGWSLFAAVRRRRRA